MSCPETSSCRASCGSPPSRRRHSPRALRAAPTIQLASVAPSSSFASPFAISAQPASGRPPSGLGAFDRYGWSVDVLHLPSGAARVIVGAPRQDFSGLNEGAAYVWESDSTGTAGWQAKFRLRDSQASSLDNLGETVALTGAAGAFVGTPNYDGNGVIDQGAVVYFDLSTIFRDGFESGGITAWFDK